MPQIVHLSARGSAWPAALETIEGPPGELWARGRLELLAQEPRIAVVGTRSPTPYGESQARRFSRAFAEHGVVVVSGLARGIDHAAHTAALDARGPTIAVLGCGVDRPWPEGELAERMLREGLVLSEFAPGEPPRRHHFPIRNRLISGLSQAVLVIEAAFASGSLITARWAADQGRSVYALPGRVDHPMARGCHRLIRDGALLVENPEDVLEDLGIAVASGDRTPPLEASPPPDPRHASLLGALRGETLSSEDLATRAGLSLSSTLTSLIELELAGAIVRGPGGLYRLG